jgi:type II secretory ATPase GspE/PulE/Tfp pilus assembly ATPase PilB-like protein
VPESSDVVSIRAELQSLDVDDPQYATLFVDHILAAAIACHASDVHLQPTKHELEVRWRIDGVLHLVGTFAPGVIADVVTRLKVMAELLTYRTDVPQEGRLRHPESSVEMRVSTFPTIHGERAVVRLFAASQELNQLHELGLPQPLQDQLTALLTETTGAILVTGPAGSGKTTTAYACLRHLVKSTRGGRSIVSLEDPVEAALPGVAQSQANPVADFDIHTGLRSLLRQDPEVILIGEIRDRDTAHVAFQAALTGQLMVTTFHAGSTSEAVSRLVDMGIEPYVLRSGILCIVAQRLVRRLCQCAEWCDDSKSMLGLPLARARLPRGCQRCGQTGYVGRMLVAELLRPRDAQIGRAILDRQDAERIEQLAKESGMKTMWEVALQHVAAGHTSSAEVRRAMGYANAPNDAAST